jgi:hypothetical protein
MKGFKRLVASAFLAASALAITATEASAWIVCNGEGECWHTHHRWQMRDEWGLVVHPDGWAWGPNDHYRWHEHDGRGYWHSGVWIKF